MYVSCHNANIVNMERPEQGIRDLKKAGFDSLATGLYSEVPMKNAVLRPFGSAGKMGFGYRFYMRRLPTRRISAKITGL